MQNKPNRRKSRAIAMELLYSDTINTRSEEINDAFIDEFIDISDTKETLDRAYITKVTSLVVEKDEYLKAVIRRFLKEWTLERISKVNLAILKLAVAEIIFLDDIPERVSLNEALELSKIYSDEEATSFINGVLDKVLKAKKSGTIPKESEVVIPEVPEIAEAPDGAEAPDANEVSELEETQSLKRATSLEETSRGEESARLEKPAVDATQPIDASQTVETTESMEQYGSGKSAENKPEEEIAKDRPEKEIDEKESVIEIPTDAMDIRTQMRLMKENRDKKNR